MPTGRPLAVPGIFPTTQWTKGGSPASGTSTITANDFVFDGAPFHSSAGDTFCPCGVIACAFGIFPPGEKAGLESLIVPDCQMELSSSLPQPPAASARATRETTATGGWRMARG